MGITTRTVTETVTEGTCDLCKKPAGEDVKVGTLSIKGLKQRGRPTSVAVAFHPDCVSKIVDTAGKGAGRAAGRAPARRAVKAASGNGRRRRAK